MYVFLYIVYLNATYDDLSNILNVLSNSNLEPVFEHMRRSFILVEATYVWGQLKMHSDHVFAKRVYNMWHCNHFRRLNK